MTASCGPSARKYVKHKSGMRQGRCSALAGSYESIGLPVLVQLNLAFG
jgi:hypothetical protein